MGGLFSNRSRGGKRDRGFGRFSLFVVAYWKKRRRNAA
jgi:hypothetical protein